MRKAKKVVTKRKPKKKQNGNGFADDVWSSAKKNKGKIATGLLLGGLGVIGASINGYNNQPSMSQPTPILYTSDNYSTVAGLGMPSDAVYMNDPFFQQFSNY
jgi:hypothetical protein